MELSVRHGDVNKDFDCMYLFIGENNEDDWIGNIVELNEEIVKLFWNLFKETDYNLRETLLKLVAIGKENTPINLENSQFKDVCAYIIFNKYKERVELYCDMVDSFYLYKGKAWTYRPELYSFIELTNIKKEELKNEIKNKFSSFLAKCNNEKVARSTILKNNLKKRTYNICVETYADENEIRKAIDKVNSNYADVLGCDDSSVYIDEADD